MSKLSCSVAVVLSLVAGGASAVSDPRVPVLETRTLPSAGGGSAVVARNSFLWLQFWSNGIENKEAYVATILEGLELVNDNGDAIPVSIVPTNSSRGDEWRIDAGRLQPGHYQLLSPFPAEFVDEFTCPTTPPCIPAQPSVILELDVVAADDLNGPSLPEIVGVQVIASGTSQDGRLRVTPVWDAPSDNYTNTADLRFDVVDVSNGELIIERAASYDLVAIHDCGVGVGDVALPPGTYAVRGYDLANNPSENMPVMTIPDLSCDDFSFPEDRGGCKAAGDTSTLGLSAMALVLFLTITARRRRIHTLAQLR